NNIDGVSLALYSLDIDDIGIRIYKYLSEVRAATPEEISEKVGVPLEETIARLDYMYSLGIIDKLGKAFICETELSNAIKNNTAKRILGILKYIANFLEEKNE
ncbi:MAG: hypothetical protein Q6363_006935, partial [Candidatus Njordarchaeota archaeon]